MTTGYKTLIGHFDFGGKTYSFVTTSELKFELNMGRWQTHLGIQTGSEEVRDMLMQVFNQLLKIKLRFNFPKSKGQIKFVDIHDCQIYKISPYPFGARAEIEGYMESSDFMEEKVMLN